MKKKFSWNHFWIKMTSRLFIAFISTTVLTAVFLLIGLLNQIEYAWFIPLIIVWGTVLILYIGGNVLIDALAKMVERASLTINQNNTVNTNISGQITGVGVGGK